MGNRALFYDSSKVQDTICAFLFKQEYPSAGDLYDTNGLDTTDIDTLIATVTAASQLSVFAVSDIGANPPAGNLVSGQITDLDALLSTVPGADTATRQIQTVTASTLPNSVKNKVLVMWENLYPTASTQYPKMLQLIGRRYMFNVLYASTATAGAASTLTNSGSSLNVDALSGFYIETTGGTGSGQIRKILRNTATIITVDIPWTTTPDNTTTYRVRNYVQSVTQEYSATATAGAATTITNSAATWTTNQWANYSVRIVSGTGANQELMIKSNTGTALTVVQAWGTNPDNTSVFQIVSYTYQNFDINVFQADIAATAGGNTTITSSTQIWPTNGFAGYLVRITSGTGSGQTRYIASNTGTVLTISNAWGTNPDNTSVFDIISRSGNWPYEFSDFYLDLSIPVFMDDPTDATLMEQFKQICGLVSNEVALRSGRGQNLTELDSLISKGEILYVAAL